MTINLYMDTMRSDRWQRRSVILSVAVGRRFLAKYPLEEFLLQTFRPGFGWEIVVDFAKVNPSYCMPLLVLRLY